MLKVPIRLTLMTRANAARACGPSLPTVFSPIAMPAQLMSPRNGPRASAASTAARPSASLETSHLTKRVAAPSSRASGSPRSAWTSAITTLAPCAASMREVAPPSPEAPPVTMNTLSLICMRPPIRARTSEPASVEEQEREGEAVASADPPRAGALTENCSVRAARAFRWRRLPGLPGRVPAPSAADIARR